MPSKACSCSFVSCWISALSASAPSTRQTSSPGPQPGLQSVLSKGQWLFPQQSCSLPYDLALPVLLLPLVTSGSQESAAPARPSPSCRAARSPGLPRPAADATPISSCRALTFCIQPHGVRSTTRTVTCAARAAVSSTVCDGAELDQGLSAPHLHIAVRGYLASPLHLCNLNVRLAHHIPPATRLQMCSLTPRRGGGKPSSQRRHARGVLRWARTL